MLDGGGVDGSILESFFALLARQKDLKGRVLFMPPIFYEKLVGSKKNVYNYSKVSHALRKKKVFDGLCKHIVIPIKRLKHHWFLIIVDVSAESIHVLDSLDNDDDKNFLNYRHCVTRHLEYTAKFEKQSSNINWALPAIPGSLSF